MNQVVHSLLEMRLYIKDANDLGLLIMYQFIRSSILSPYSQCVIAFSGRIYFKFSFSLEAPIPLIHLNSWFSGLSLFSLLSSEGLAATKGDKPT